MRPLHRSRTVDQGFTLVELLVVMVIIGVLAAIAVPTFLGQRQKARETALKADLKNIATEVNASWLAAGTYPVASELDLAGTKLRTSPTVRASVIWATASDFCLVGTSSRGSLDPSGPGQQVGISTRVYAVSARRPVAPVTANDQSCLNVRPPTAVLSNANGYWAEDGYHASAFTG